MPPTYTVVYSTNDFPNTVMYAPVEAPNELKAQIKFTEVFRKCFGNSLHFTIREVRYGYKRTEPHAE